MARADPRPTANGKLRLTDLPAPLQNALRTIADAGYGVKYRPSPTGNPMDGIVSITDRQLGFVLRQTVAADLFADHQAIEARKAKLRA